MIHVGRLPLILLLALPALAVSGCGENRVPVFRVSGKLTFQGRPPVGAQVVLHAVDHAQPSDVTPLGIVQEDGSFTITAYEPGDGAPLGDYVATVQWFKVVGDKSGSGRGPNILPPRYARPETSPIKVSVSEEGAQLPPIEISRR
jgi:hypothetical protein